MLLLLVTLFMTGYSCPHIAKITTIPSKDLYRIQLDNFHNVESWTFRGQTFKKNSGYTHFKATDCENTEYPLTVTCKIRDGNSVRLEEHIQMIKLEPIELHLLSQYSDKDFNKDSLVIVNPGEDATLTCMSDEEEAEFLNKFGFKPIYTWKTQNDYPHERGVYQDHLEEGNKLELNSVYCGAANYYKCFLRRCTSHYVAPCNGINVVVRTPPYNRFEGKKLCRVFGDPHITTFDGMMYSYKGMCWYVLAMDSVRYKWFVYGQFTECGNYSSCLESISIVARTADKPNGIQLQLLKGFAMNLYGKKEFLKRFETKNFDGLEAHFTGDNLEITFAEYDITVIWDGLTFLKIIINEGVEVIGLCGNNDGDPNNDLKASFDGKDRDSDLFADSWSTSRDCKLSDEKAVPDLLRTFTDLDDYLERISQYTSGDTKGINVWDDMTKLEFCEESIAAHTQLAPVAEALEKIDTPLSYFLLNSCTNDVWLTRYDYYSDVNFQKCTSMFVLADLAESLGYCINNWSESSRCPTVWEKREEAVRLGCIWSREQKDAVLSSGDISA